MTYWDWAGRTVAMAEQVDLRVDAQAGWKANRPTGQQANRPTGRRANRQSGRQADGQTGQQADRQTGQHANGRVGLTFSVGSLFSSKPLKTKIIIYFSRVFKDNI